MSVLSIKAGQDPESFMLGLSATLYKGSGPSPLIGQISMTPEWTGAEWEDRLILLRDWIRDLEKLYEIEREGSLG